MIVTDSIPITVCSVEHSAGLTKQMSIQYVVCPSYSVVYEYKDCVRTLSDGTTESKTCCHVATSNHPQRSRRAACATLLLKKQNRKKSSLDSQ